LREGDGERLEQSTVPLGELDSTLCAALAP